MHTFCKFFVIIFLSVSSLACVSSSIAQTDSTTSYNSTTKEQRAILITGASSGIGKDMAITLSQNGFYVYAGARKSKDIQALSAIPNIQGIRLDVTIQKDIDMAVSTIKQEGRGLYGLINNAGVFLFDPLIEISERDMQFIMDVNVFGPYRVTKAFAPLLIENKGRIMTTGSVAGLFSARLFGPYGMTKHAMEAYTDALDGEMKKFDVEVGIVEPGNFRSNIMKNMQKRIDQLNSGQRDSLYKDEIKGFANFAKTDRSAHMEPKPVSDAALHFMSSDKPKRRYLVTPNAQEAKYAIQQSLRRTLELNDDQVFEQSRDEIVDLIDILLTDFNE